MWRSIVASGAALSLRYLCSGRRAEGVDLICALRGTSGSARGGRPRELYRTPSRRARRRAFLAMAPPPRPRRSRRAALHRRCHGPDGPRGTRPRPPRAARTSPGRRARRLRCRSGSRPATGARCRLRAWLAASWWNRCTRAPLEARAQLSSSKPGTSTAMIPSAFSACTTSRTTARLEFDAAPTARFLLDKSWARLQASHGC